MDGICEDLEDAGDSGDLAEASRLLVTLDQEFGHVRSELQVLLQDQK